MPALLPVFLAGSHLILAAERIPDLNIEPSCRAASVAATAANRNETTCKRDENDARTRLGQEWGDFSSQQKTRCVSLSRLGGNPSYVELLTCLELAKAADALPPEDRLEGPAAR